MAEIVKNRPQELTRAELEIMQVLWNRGAAVVHGILDEMDEPKPAYNTVSTIVRILEKKGFVARPMARPMNTTPSSRRTTMRAATWIPC